MTRSFRGVWCGGLFAVMVCCSAPRVANATKYDTSPRQAILFTDGTRIVARDGMKSHTLYRVADGAVIRRFADADAVTLSPDEKQLLVSRTDGGMFLWDVETGEQVWWKDPAATGLKSSAWANFAGNGERFACSTGDGVAVFDARTGDRIATIGARSSVWAVALAPDGTRGFFLEFETAAYERLFSFDVATGRVTATLYFGAGPICYSTDGKFVAFRHSNSGAADCLSVIRLGNELTKYDLGEFSHIGHIRPAHDGSFLVSARTKRRDDERGHREFVGAQIWPDSRRVQEVWRFTMEQGVNELTDYSPERMIGVSTDVGLVTTITDLRTGKVTRTIDNGANYVPELISGSPHGPRPEEAYEPSLWVVLVFASIFVLLAGVVVWRVRRAG